MKSILDYPGGPNVITSFLIRGRQEGHDQRRINVWKLKGSRFQPIKNVLTLRTARNGMC